MDVSDAAARRDRRRGQDHEMVQGGRRCREAGRQPVRDRDRQGVDGGAVDHHRHAGRDQGAGRRDRAGRRRGRGDRGRGRCGCECAGCESPAARIEAAAAASSERSPRKRDPVARTGPAQRGRRGSSRLASDSIRSSRCARRRAISVRRKPRAARFVTPLARRLAGENGIDLSRMSGSGPRGRIVAADIESAIAKGGGRAAPHGDRRVGRRRSRRSTRASSSRRCRSTACARPSRAAWSRPSRPSRTSISSPT